MWHYECEKCLASGESEDMPGDPCGCEPAEGFEQEGDCDGHLVCSRHEELAKLTAREQEVMAATIGFEGPIHATVMVRLLNIKSPCEWCPIDPIHPRKNRQDVSKSSTQKAYRVLKSLANKGKIRDLKSRRFAILNADV